VENALAAAENTTRSRKHILFSGRHSQHTAPKKRIPRKNVSAYFTFCVVGARRDLHKYIGVRFVADTHLFYVFINLTFFSPISHTMCARPCIIRIIIHAAAAKKQQQVNMCARGHEQIFGGKRRLLLHCTII
jgi:hypothetical protein